MLLNIKTAASNDEQIIPLKGKYYLIKIISRELKNGKPDKLFAGKYLAKFNGKHFVIGNLKRRRNNEQVKIISEAEIN